MHRIHELEKARDAAVEDDIAFGSLVDMACKLPPTSIAVQVAQQIRSARNMSRKADLPFSNAADHLFNMELDTNQNTEFRDIIGNHILVFVPSAIATYYDDGDRAFRNLTLASSEARQVRMDYDGEGRRVDVTMASLRMTKPSRPLLDIVYDLSTVITDEARVGSVVNVASKLSSASFDAQVALDEMPTSGWRSPGRFLDV
jgi:YD repeat-containing protein